ncbi:MAG: SDR family oxidoreductase [Blastococcus sp.]
MPPDDAPTSRLCLVTGATGYIGGRLVPELLAAGHHVRVLTRSPDRLRDHPWAGAVEIVRADATDADQVAAACAGVDVVHYLIHALGSGPEFEETDRRTAQVMARAAREAGVGRLVYLGALEPQGEELSPHLRSRTEVASILLASGVPTVVLRAAIVLGSGSASFEMLRYLTERLPLMVTPRWVHSRIQPIAVRDVLRYLVGCATLPASVHRAFDVGGPDRMSYAEMMQRYAAVAGLPRRRILPVPLFSPSLSSHWVGLITPVPAGIARPLVESLRNTVVCREHDIAAYLPDPPEGLLGFDDAVRLAVQRVKDSAVPTRWASASVPHAPSDPLPTDPDWAGGSLYVDERTRPTGAPPAAVWRVVEGIGGDNGWYSFPLAWSVRGWLDRLVGGVGLRRGRRDPHRLYVGDALDFWRVEALEEGRLLRLRAEMRLPGLAWLEFHVEHGDSGGGGGGGGRTVLRQRATFSPRGLAGHLYWWAIAAFHGIVFGGMVRGLTRAAEAAVASTPGVSTRR